MDSLLSRLFLYWQTRSLGIGVERLMVILPVAIYFDHQVHEEELKKAQKILRERIEPQNLADSVFDRIQLRLEEYQKSYEEYIADRQKALEIITQDIQLYAVIREIFESDGVVGESEESIEDIIKKKFDEAWELDDPKKRLLEEQEKHYERGWKIENPLKKP
ncbi:MAG: hypothetical protein GXX07_07405 [Wolinella succinogenes]|uniref:hypothetical protein n=1 Tax=Wolinella succinogenes TaxID=844 RepID=UPI0016955E44|nr:hypothetical protein [Wolinella succinogenes]NLU34778.1 hypothetical protein [Wolinella succinogenes]